MNSFESGTRKAIPAVLIYPRQNDRILMIHRNRKPNDYHAGKWNGLGGKLEVDESPLEAAMRELKEESGLELSQEAFQPLGVIQFPNFKAGQDWIVWVFSARVPVQAQISAGDEGSLHWIPIPEVQALNLWTGDRHFISFVLKEQPFMGTIWYQGENVVRHLITKLGPWEPSSKT